MLQKILNHKFVISLIPGVFVLLHILWEYFHGGVTRHHLLAREDLPAISNWWGLLSIPLLSWLTLTLIGKRLRTADRDSAVNFESVIRFFLGGLAHGLVLAVLWEFGKVGYMPFVLWFPLVLALFLPTYRAEWLLGFVLGLAFTFGGVLPIFIGLVLLALSFIIHKGIRRAIRALGRRN
jgi:hypothetical protein